MNEISIHLNLDNIKCADALKKAGFKNVMVAYAHEIDKEKEIDIIRYSKTIGLKPILGHLLYSGINDLWLDNKEGDLLVNNLKEDIITLANEGLPEVCMHLTSKFKAPPYNELGLKRIKELNEVAKKHHIRLSLENTKIKGYQEYVIENIKDDNLGICVDSGHVHCHFNDEYDLDLFKDRIFSLHLHDNDGKDDQHLLPFDGTIDWEKLFINLKRNNFQGYINLELSFKNYPDINIEDFYKEAYQRAIRLQSLI